MRLLSFFLFVLISSCSFNQRLNEREYLYRSEFLVLTALSNAVYKERIELNSDKGLFKKYRLPAIPKKSSSYADSSLILIEGLYDDFIYEGKRMYFLDGVLEWEVHVLGKNSVAFTDYANLNKEVPYFMTWFLDQETLEPYYVEMIYSGENIGIRDHFGSECLKYGAFRSWRLDTMFTVDLAFSHSLEVMEFMETHSKEDSSLFNQMKRWY